MIFRTLKKPAAAAALSVCLLFQSMPLYAANSNSSKTSKTSSAAQAQRILPSAALSDEFREVWKTISLAPYPDVDPTGVTLSWEQLEEELTSRIESYSSKWSLYLKDLTTGKIISIHDRPQESASLIKLYVMGAVMQHIQNGDLEMNNSIEKLLDDMITVSDNSATNDLVRYLDSDRDHRKGMEKVNAFIDEQGFDNTHEYNGLEDQSLWYGDGKTNITSTRNCGDLLERIYQGQFVSHLASRKMEGLLLDQEITYKIPSTIPSESTVANKTGETSDCENDAAIVYTPKGDYILCIMSCEVESKDDAVSALRDMSKLVYNHFINRKTLPDADIVVEYYSENGKDTLAETEIESASETEHTEKRKKETKSKSKKTASSDQED